ncbi:MAG: TonB-dependent receptor [Thermodesulfovibrio sp.]|nr:TonB-dependent receptor [Thermodesulfovibrio sp.]
MIPQGFAKVTTVEEIEEIVVVGERLIKDKQEISLKSETLPASVHVITKEDIEKMSVRNYVDLFRKLPGMITNHLGQGDIADGLGMRGYSSSHGSQVAVFVDGVPLNVPHHSHSHGFADVNWIIPEMIERIEIIKGPFSPLYGNFALGGVINIITKKVAPNSTFGTEVGRYESYRAVVSFSQKDWKYKPFLVYEAYEKEGFRDNSEYSRYNFFNKITFLVGNGYLSARLAFIKRDWGAPGYLSLNDVKMGLVKRTQAINPTDGGKSEYYNLVLNYSPKGGEAGFHGTLFASLEDHKRFATFIPRPQRLEWNERFYYGWNFLYNYLFWNNLSVIIGTDGRYDNGDRKRFWTNRRRISSTTQNWHINELGIGIFSQIQYKPIEYFKIVGGLRYDYFNFDIENKIRPNNSGKGNTYIFSPKIGFTFNPYKNFYFYVNKGLGFRTPSADEMSPVDRDYKNFNLKPAKVDTWDIGFNIFILNKVLFDFNYYHTDMEREIRVVGPLTLAIGESQRKGFELQSKFFILDRLSLFLNYAYVKAKIKNPSIPGEDKIIGVPRKYFNGGLEYEYIFAKDKKIVVDLAYQYLGETPLNSAGTIWRSPVDRYLLKISHIFKNWNFWGELFYHPRKYVSEAMFISGGVVRYDPKPKLDINFGLKFNF